MASRAPFEHTGTRHSDAQRRTGIRLRIRTLDDVERGPRHSPIQIHDHDDDMFLDEHDIASIAGDIGNGADLDVHTTATTNTETPRNTSSVPVNARTASDRASQGSMNAAPPRFVSHSPTPRMNPLFTPIASRPSPMRCQSSSSQPTPKQPRHESHSMLPPTAPSDSQVNQRHEQTHVNMVHGCDGTVSSATGVLPPQAHSIQPMGGFGIVYGSMLHGDLQSALVRAQLARVTQEREENERSARDSRMREAQLRAYYGFPF